MVEVLERGDIFFAYLPRVDTSSVRGLDDVQRMFVLLATRERRWFRRFQIGRKRLPEPDRHERHWSFVDAVGNHPDAVKGDFAARRYTTKTAGERLQPEARPAGEGVYALVRHGDHLHLVYRLELPEARGPVQAALGIEREASYILVGRRASAAPRAPGPRGGVGWERLDVEQLDEAGTEAVWIGASDDVGGELGVALPAEGESIASADIFGSLRLDEETDTTRPLLDGAWE